jgi:TRAP-type mannitol/chloroaromatic compound transport system substrate-binding protein
MMKILALGALALSLTTSTAMADKVNWKMHSAYAGTLPVNGTGAKEFAEHVSKLTDGSVRLRHFEPGALLPALDYYDAVSEGSIEAAWGGPAFYASKNSAYMLFASVPFGPDAVEYLAWMRHGGGQELWAELLAKDNLVSIPCTIVAPEAAGWFRKEIASTDDFAGMRIRFLGFGGRVLQRMGASPQLLAPGDIYTALEMGTIDATEFAMPMQDEALGFHEIAKNYYFPGWHQQSTFLDLLVNKPLYDGLTEQQKAALHAACDAQIVKSIADGEGKNFPAMKRLTEEHGAVLRKLDDGILEQFRTAWNEVAQEEVTANPDFAKAWESYSQFRDDYALWRDNAYLR